MSRSDKALTLSIIIPAYNEEHYLKGCLESIAAQTVKPDEVIVIDNNSTDRTATVATEFSFVKLLQENVQGIVPTRNVGLNAASGKIIGRIDADTRLPPNWVERVKDFYSNPTNQSTALTGGGYFYNMRARRFNGWFWTLLAHRVNYLVIGHNILWGSNMALPKTLWKKVESKTCNREDIHEDIDIAIHLNRLNYEIKYMPSLKVGALLKRVYTDHADLHEHMARWPRTLRSHGYKLWWFGSLGNVFLWAMQPVAFFAEYFSRYLLRKKSLKE